MVSATLVCWAEVEFPFLMFHPDNRDDAMQELAMSKVEMDGNEDARAARATLSALAHRLGYRRTGDGWKKVA